VRVLVARRVDPAAVALLRRSADVEYHDENQPLPRAYLLEHVHAFDAVLSTVTERFDAEVLRRGTPRLRAVSNMAAGLDNVDVACAAELGIRVFNAPESTVEATADHTLAVALALIRQVVPAGRFVRDGGWKGWDPYLFLGRTISGLTWGLYGFGRIGQAVARRAAAFGASISYYDRSVSITSLDGGVAVRRVGRDELLAGSDVLSVHVPLTAETTGCIGGAELRSMKPGAFLVNMARGKVVDSAALAEVLRQRRIAGAALDVFDPEPLGPPHEILEIDNVLLTPHIGTGTVECRREMAVQAARNLIDFFAESRG